MSDLSCELDPQHAWPGFLRCVLSRLEMILNMCVFVSPKFDREPQGDRDPGGLFPRGVVRCQDRAWHTVKDQQEFVIGRTKEASAGLPPLVFFLIN